MMNLLGAMMLILFFLLTVSISFMARGQQVDGTHFYNNSFLSRWMDNPMAGVHPTTGVSKKILRTAV